MILLEPIGFLHEMLHRPALRALLSLEQGLTFLLVYVFKIVEVHSERFTQYFEIQIW